MKFKTITNKRLYLAITMALVMAFPYKTFGQGCYKDTRKEAINTFAKKNFQRAKQMFNAARSCPDTPTNNDLGYWIKKCDNAVGPNKQTQNTELSFAQKMALYESEGDWREGMMPVTKKSDWKKQESSQDNNPFNLPKVGFINERGDLVIPCQFIYDAMLPLTFFTHMNKFSEGLAAVAKYFTDNDGEVYYCVGYIDKSGRTVIPFDFSFATAFSEGIAAVSEEDFYESSTIYFIDKKGNRIGDSKFYFVQRFHDGMCAVMKDSTSGWGFADKTGKIVIPCDYEKVGDFKNGTAAVIDKAHMPNYEYALIDKTNSLVGNYQFRPECLEWMDLRECIAKYENSNKERHFVCLKEWEKRRKLENNGEWKMDYNEADFACMLGSCYKEGVGGAVKNTDIAIEYWKKAADYHPHSLFLLGYTYSEMKDYTKSREYYQKLIDKQVSSNKKDYLASAYYNIGIQCYNGQGMEPDFNKALDYFKKAKEAGGKSNCDDMIEKCNHKLGL